MPNVQAPAVWPCWSIAPKHQCTESMITLLSTPRKNLGVAVYVSAMSVLGAGVGFFQLIQETYMSAELDSVLEVLKTMFTELADDLSDLRGEALAAKI